MADELFYDVKKTMEGVNMERSRFSENGRAFAARQLQGSHGENVVRILLEHFDCEVRRTGAEIVAGTDFLKRTRGVMDSATQAVRRHPDFMVMWPLPPRLVEVKTTKRTRSWGADDGYLRLLGANFPGLILVIVSTPGLEIYAARIEDLLARANQAPPRQGLHFFEFGTLHPLDRYFPEIDPVELEELRQVLAQHSQGGRN